MICGNGGSADHSPKGFALAFIVLVLALPLFLRPATGETQILVNPELETAPELENPVSLDVLVSQVSIDTATIRSRFQQRSGAPKTSDFSQMVFCSIHQVYEAKADLKLARQARPAFYDPLGLSTQSSVHTRTAYELGGDRRVLEIDDLDSGSGSFHSGNSCPRCFPELKASPKQ